MGAPRILRRCGEIFGIGTIHCLRQIPISTHGGCFPSPPFPHRAGAAPAPPVAELGVVRPIRALVSIGRSSYDDRIDMDTVTLSPKFQVVIPQAIREALHLTAGEKLRVLRYADRVEFIPVRPIQEMRGFLRGMDTTIEREDDRL